MDLVFQTLCNFFPAYKINNKLKKKIFYFIFSVLKIFLKGPFIMNFKNFKIFTYPQKGEYTRYIITRCNIPDPAERELIARNLNAKKNIFVDCGANAGFYTLDIATKVTNLKVFAFEPSKREVMLLKNNLKLNNINNVEVMEMAVGDKQGLAIFNDIKDPSIKNSSGQGYISEKFSNNKNSYEVKISTLDNFFKDVNFPEDADIFMKFDLEGYDFKAIRGAQKTILKYNCSIIFEFSKMIIRQNDYTMNDLTIFLKNNYILYDINGKVISPNELEKRIYHLKKNQDTCGNYILSKKKLKFNF